MGDPVQKDDQVPDNQNLDNDNLDNDNLDNQNLNVDDDAPKISEADEKALGLGWKPKDDWEGDPDDWTSSKRFLQTRDIIESNKSLRANLDSMQHNFDNRITGLQKFHQQNLESQLKHLKTKRDNAAQDADMDTYNEANKQIDELVNPDVSRETQPNKQQELIAGIVNHPVTQSFINENPWIKDNNSAKGVYGQQVFTNWIAANKNNPNAILEDGLKLVKESVNREFPQNNPNRDNVLQMGDKGNGPRKMASRNRLTMDDLNREEMNIWHSMGDTWKNEEDFLQAVADSRKGE